MIRVVSAALSVGAGRAAFLCDRIKVFYEYLEFLLIFVSINEHVRDSYRLHFALYANCFSNPVEIDRFNRVGCEAVRA